MRDTPRHRSGCAAAAAAVGRARVVRFVLAGAAAID